MKLFRWEWSKGGKIYGGEIVAPSLGNAGEQIRSMIADEPLGSDRQLILKEMLTRAPMVYDREKVS